NTHDSKDHDGSRGRDLSSALAAWRDLLGHGWVLTSQVDIAHYARTCSSRSQTSLAILKPGGRDEVVEIVKIARRYKIPLYPISTGQNWGYGDACPVHDGQDHPGSEPDEWHP
ncbi:MAG: FAD-binding protein, partial [Chromatiales bacterium]|nr:FAD-binding protein [Chromatiales bacterium]